ncbi:unnamed protein product [Adineta ricciae]|uniref:Uncharacterized protein n=1 Tax=Adineta ricciae TaxID=249248 RepID=A0A816HJE3_ADIRI|nr:unnamed protein product [Adineta ricciae]
MFRHLLQRLWRAFLQLNLYKNSSSSNQTLLTEYFAPRIYVCSLILVITITTAFMIRPVNQIEYLPSSERFTELVSKYPSHIHCPCAKIGISYKTFVTTHVKFHQVCSSQFVEQIWIDKIYSAQNMTLSSLSDFRARLIFFLATYCRILLY